MKLIDQETIRDGQFGIEVLHSGLPVTGTKSGSYHRVAKQQSLPDYLDLEECSSQRRVRILLSHILDYKRLEPGHSDSNYDGILRVANQCALEPS